MNRSAAWLKKMRVTGTLIALACVLMVPLLGFSHSVVPHNHAHGTDFHTELFAGLNTALSRKDLTAVLFTSFGVLFAITVFLALPSRRYAPVRINIPQHEALRRGRIPYRTFL